MEEGTSTAVTSDALQLLPDAADVPAPSAFHYLDELLSLDKISETNVVRLKDSFRLLSDTLKRSQDTEVQLLEKAKRSRAELNRLRDDLQGTEESTSEVPKSEVSELRLQLLKAYNELKAAEHIDLALQHKLKCLLEEKRCLVKENELHPTPAELECRTKALQDKHEDLKKEIAQRQMEVRGLTEDLETNEKQILKELKELEDMKRIIELKEAEKAQLISIPDRILKDTERKQSDKDAATKNLETLTVEISVVKQQVKDAEECNLSLKSKKKGMVEELEGLRTRAAACRGRFRQLQKDREVFKEGEAEVMGQRGILEMKLKNIICDRKHLYESLSAQRRENNRQMQALKRMENALARGTEQLQLTRSTYSNLQAQIAAVPNREACVQQRTELQKEVDDLKVCFENTRSTAAAERQKKKQLELVQELLRESNCLREELHNLRCLMLIKAEERGQKHREMLRAEQMSRHITKELRQKDLVIADQNKLNVVLQRRMLQYCKLCDVIMEEKNKYVKLKDISSQTVIELMERIKLLENEADIQHSIVINKDRSLKKARMKMYHGSKTRDKLRNNISKIGWKRRQVSQVSEDNKLQLRKLRQTINLQEQTLVELNKNHEVAVQRRNFLGIQLLEHEEVLLGYHKTANSQETDTDKSKNTLDAVEKEMRDLQVAINEEKRRIDYKKKEIPVKKKLEEEITLLQIQLLEARDQTLRGLNRTADYKELKGKDPPMDELLRKMKTLEADLAERERQLLEKELLVDQVTRLSEPLREQQENNKQDGLSLAKKLSEIRAHILDTSLRTMAVSAELSMKQAAALSLQQEIKEKELQMDRWQQRLEQGLPPCPEIEEEWRRMLRDKKRRQRNKEERERLADEEEWNQLPNGEFTTAEPRPGAYVPVGDPLPLPKPYGAQAPFKPSQPGAAMRHIRKPASKSLDVEETLH